VGHPSLRADSTHFFPHGQAMALGPSQAEKAGSHSARMEVASKRMAASFILYAETSVRVRCRHVNKGSQTLGKTYFDTINFCGIACMAIRLRNNQISTTQIL
jgi:hypothetical protein